MELGGLKYLVVGAGIFGSVIAERIAKVLNQKVLVIDKRDHIAGNCFSEVDKQTGVEVHRYGPHIFHTSDRQVWEYVTGFTEFNRYQHKVLTTHKNKIYSMPINLDTINSYYGGANSPSRAREMIRKETGEAAIGDPDNLEEKAISLIGKPLYEAFIKGYTHKQWETDPRTLPASIINRLPIRYNYNTRYFNDTWEGIPVDGYTEVFRRILDHPNITVSTGTDFFDLRKQVPSDCLVIYTGPLDRLFDYKHGVLGWRTVTFAEEVHEVEDFQGTSVMNYADVEVPYTRIVEFKHFHPERKVVPKTIIFKEFSKVARAGDDPYYPINTAEDVRMLSLYKEEVKKLPNLIVGGRLGSYKYWDMHHAMAIALGTFDKKVKNHRFDGRADQRRRQTPEAGSSI